MIDDEPCGFLRIRSILAVEQLLRRSGLSLADIFDEECTTFVLPETKADGATALTRVPPHTVSIASVSVKRTRAVFAAV